MSRRILVVLLLTGLAALAGAVVPWTISSDRLKSAVSAQLRNIYGLDLSVGGRSTIALLPVPRLTFEDIALAPRDGKPVVRGGSLRGEVRILPLLAARLELAELSLIGTAIDVEVDDSGFSPWDRAIANFRERFEAPGRRGHIIRIVLKDTDLQIRHHRTQSETVLRDIDLAADWPAADAALDLVGSLLWRGEPVEVTAAVRPGALAAGRASRIVIQATAPLARLAMNGDVSWSAVPRFVGRTSVETRSLRDFARWSGLDLPLAALIQAFAIEGEMTIDGSDLSWPTARLNLSGDRLEGALSSRQEGERRMITGTLAADRLDLTSFVMPLLQARSTESSWVSDGVGLGGRSGTDLDLRFSASTARVGLLRMQDLAANISFKPGRYEAAVGRVSINKGVAKGRATIAGTADGVEVKGQSSFERLDLGSLLSDLGSSRWISGLAQGQFTFEGSGNDAAEIIQHLHGRASVTVRQGELADLKLSEALRRADGKALATLPAARSGRMPFEEAQLRATVTDGVADIGDSALNAAGLRAALHGHAFLPDRYLILKAVLEGSPPSFPIVLDVTGPWDNVVISADAGRKTGDTGPGSAAAVQ